MQVYELITELSKLPAGAEVEFSTLVTADEYNSSPIVDYDDGPLSHRIAGPITDVDVVSDDLVILHL